MGNSNDTTITREIRRKEETAQRLISARKALGWSRDELIRRSGLAKSSIEKFETAHRPVSIEAAAVFQELFNLPAAWFLDLMTPEGLAFARTEGFTGDPGKDDYASTHNVIVVPARRRSRKDEEDAG